MGVGGVEGVEGVEDRLEVTMGARLAAQRPLAEPRLTLAELRHCLQQASDLGGPGSGLTPVERSLLMDGAEALRRRVEHFNGSLPEGLRVELSPHLARWLAGTVVERS
jgi:hypothetical protein